MDNAILYYVDPKVSSPGKVVVPSHLQGKIMSECHGGVISVHFAGKKLYKTLRRRWWWDTMYRDLMEFARNCAEWVWPSGERVWQTGATTPTPYLSQSSLSDLGSGNHGVTPY